MAEALATPTFRGGVRAGPAHSRRTTRAGRAAGRARLRPTTALTVRESRRADNRRRIVLGSELRCECARPSCRETVPVVAETQRGAGRRFVVAPTHFEGDIVVRAADRFFVVETPGEEPDSIGAP